MIKVTLQGNTTPDNREFVIIAGGKCLFRGELSPELQSSDVWAEIGKLLRDYQAEEQTTSKINWSKVPERIQLDELKQFRDDAYNS
jgi:hypothetical protein